MARPRKTLPENGLALIRALAANGVAETEIAAALGMDIKTWKRIRQDDADARAAWDEARTLELDRLVKSLFAQAMGAPAEFDGDGNQLRAERPPNSGAGMFLLKSRHSYRDVGPTDGGNEGRPTVVINLPGPLNPEQFARLVETAPAGLPAPERARDAA